MAKDVEVTGTDKSGSVTDADKSGEPQEEAKFKEWWGKKERQHKRQVQRAKEEATKEVLSSVAELFGVDDVSDLPSLADRLKVSQESESKVAVAEKAISRLQQEIADKAAAGEKWQQRFKQQAIRSAVINAASRESHDPETVYRLVGDLFDADEEGEVFVKDSDSTVETVLEKLLADKPYLAKAKGVSGSGGRSPDGGAQVARKIDLSDPKTFDALLLQAAIKDGLIKG